MFTITPRVFSRPTGLAGAGKEAVTHSNAPIRHFLGSVPRQCKGSVHTPLDKGLAISPYCLLYSFPYFVMSSERVCSFINKFIHKGTNWRHKPLKVSLVHHDPLRVRLLMTVRIDVVERIKTILIFVKGLWLSQVRIKSRILSSDC